MIPFEKQYKKLYKNSLYGSMRINSNNFWTIPSDEEVKKKLEAIGIDGKAFMNEIFVSGTHKGGGTQINSLPSGMTLNVPRCLYCNRLICSIHNNMHYIYKSISPPNLTDIFGRDVNPQYYIYKNNTIQLRVDNIIIKEYDGDVTIFNYFGTYDSDKIHTEFRDNILFSIAELYAEEKRNISFSEKNDFFIELFDRHNIFLEGHNQ